MEHLLPALPRALLNLLFPIRCQGCGVKLAFDDKRYLCGGCLKKIGLNEPPFCIKCGRSVVGEVNLKTLCAGCLKDDYHFQASWQCCRYDGLMKELIHLFKYRRKAFLKNVFLEIMHKFMSTHIDTSSIGAIIPVPLCRTSLVQRGFNQTALLSDGLSVIFGIPSLKGRLIKTKKTAQQIALSRKDRFTNVRGAFSVINPSGIKSKRVLLIDDVFTTGATANECAKALTAAGAERVYVLALARGV